MSASALIPSAKTPKGDAFHGFGKSRLVARSPLPMLTGKALLTVWDVKADQSLLCARPFVTYGRNVNLVCRVFSMNILKVWFEAPFRLILLAMRIYKANTARIARLMGHVEARQVLNAAILITVGLWLVIFVFLGDERRNDLSRAVQEWVPFSGE